MSGSAAHRPARTSSGASQLSGGVGVRTVIYRDPDGNEIGFGGAPQATGAS
ncbi:hypothetical protein [Plantactinospora sp. CA-290183]|uniref:hypothetical protein n=1 Tax=Plantactinospora sp. CA-290183 TaxID=3240006 RepID=UPI003D8CFC96